MHTRFYIIENISLCFLSAQYDGGEWTLFYGAHYTETLHYKISSIDFESDDMMMMELVK